MPRISRVLFGYRDDVDLRTRWWHRMYQVVLTLSTVVVFVKLLEWSTDSTTQMIYQGLGTSPEIAPHPGEAWPLAIVWTSLLWLAVENLYYRPFLYIVFGARKR
jgi:hypothetical protein